MKIIFIKFQKLINIKIQEMQILVQEFHQIKTKIIIIIIVKIKIKIKMKKKKKKKKMKK